MDATAPLYPIQIKKRNEEEIELLKKALVRLGTKQADGSITVKFGTVFKVCTYCLYFYG